QLAFWSMRALKLGPTGCAVGCGRQLMKRRKSIWRSIVNRRWNSFTRPFRSPRTGCSIHNICMNGGATMRLLVIGVSGDVGTLVIPLLRHQDELRVFDLRSLAHSNCGYVQGNVTDPDALARAAEGMDVLLFMAMGDNGFDTLEAEITAFDVSVKGV